MEWLEDLLAVAETGSFSESAERRSLAQSAFSRRIRQIEDYVGVELFDRSHKPVQLQRTTESSATESSRLSARCASWWPICAAAARWRRITLCWRASTR